MGSLMNAIIGWLTDAAMSILSSLLALLRATAFVLPDVTGVPQVVHLSHQALLLVDATYVLIIVAAGGLVMARDNLQVRYGLSELAPRLVVGFVAANFTSPLCARAIGLANAVTRALTGQDLGGRASWKQLNATIVGSMNQTSGLLALVIGLVICVLAAGLIVLWLARIGALIMLVALAPVAVACVGLPHTEPVARLWARSLAGVLIVQVLQSVLLFTAVRVLLSPKANLEALGIPNDGNTLLNLLVVICVLWAAVRLPGLVVKQVLRGGNSSPNPVATVLRVVVVQRLLRMMPGGRAASRATRGARS